ncbi:MAG TPA: bifunctional methylenetetrahydrofolate dehydrogenase/methenyltetrahydrofolate cyclohydrolase FolD [Alphaproteobacteria bacterium]|jgi:methylenetetrahydrofolate dehydrogenase (NADP+)/methenyltetrahydrofolate cyclohydrolase|nr:bifunctional methylenetetrahydrofolate dehydrogenase/methenyltetrahydrofolate cyclohydrolase FolD [SAR116 cluster bacterium]HCV61764.1 bifunctional methylenetetrahydrofolate dehydrogenase/methenyltetrahydrofolate cyclohydrolase FolD [Alphaproteobacteria bacterium]|tara:strand:+ start:1003 stop:1896 length:894 start_codon:yes stop_codon:yes gene_type:complete
MADIIDGKAFAESLRKRIASETARIKSEANVTPGLAVVLVGEDPASKVYVKNKGKQTVEAGMNSIEHRLDENVSQDELLSLINDLNNDPGVHGILCQLPLPKHLDESMVINAINPEKDVDGFHISNVGLLGTGQKSMVPCTPLGCLMMLRDHLGTLAGVNAVVIGKSNIVGKPMIQLLLNDGATVTTVHSRTRDIDSITRTADVLVVAVGRPEMVKPEWIKEGAVIIDVGINRVPAPDLGENKSRIVGDVDYAGCAEKAGAITPVPGGVGPMTIACLLANTLTACSRLHGLEDPVLN